MTTESTADPFNEWFQRNWRELLREFFTIKPRMVFDAFCDMKFVNRREDIARTYYSTTTKGKNESTIN